MFINQNTAEILIICIAIWLFNIITKQWRDMFRHISLILIRKNKEKCYKELCHGPMRILYSICFAVYLWRRDHSRLLWFFVDIFRTLSYFNTYNTAIHILAIGLCIIIVNDFRLLVCSFVCCMCRYPFTLYGFSSIALKRRIWLFVDTRDFFRRKTQIYDF